MSGSARTARAGAAIRRPGSPTLDFIQVREQGGSIPGLCYRAGSPLCGGTFLASTGWIMANTWHAHFSYVTGSHNFKAGYNGLYDNDNQQSNFANSQGLVYQFNNGVPNQFWELSGMFDSQWRTRFDAFFAQDQWTMNKLTVQGALRYDHAWSYYPPVAHRRHAVHSGRDGHPASRTASTSRTSRRESAPPTICSATGRRR